MPKRRSHTRGFARTATLLDGQIRKASESRGFAVSRVLTHWAEIVGLDIASMARPVDVSYSRGGMGATLTVLTTGAQAPVLDMQKDKMRDRVNAAYGYNAIARVRITQTAATGFADGQAVFEHRPEAQTNAPPSHEIVAQASKAAAGVADETLRSALERLGQNVLKKRRN